MSGQIDDTISWENSDFSIIKTKNNLPFNPSEHGITPSDISSDCVRGFWCNFSIAGNELFIENLYIHSKNNHYPAICGTLPLTKNETFDDDYRTYSNLHLKLDYTDRVLVGKDFLPEHYIHTWTQKPWAYKNIFELVFTNGQLVKAIDHSKIVTDIRKQINENETLRKKLELPLTRIIISGKDILPRGYDADFWWI